MTLVTLPLATVNDLVVAVENAQRVLASYERVLTDRGNTSQSAGVHSHHVILAAALAEVKRQLAIAQKGSK